MLEHILGKFLVLKGVSAVTLIHRDGEVIESEETIPLNEQAVGAVVSFVLAESAALAQGLEKDNFSMVIVEFEDLLLISSPLSDDIFIVIIAGAHANIGQVSYELRKIKDEILVNA
jgi:Uncharacterized distant relative of homeotic protein bithoraxoid